MVAGDRSCCQGAYSVVLVKAAEQLAKPAEVIWLARKEVNETREGRALDIGCAPRENRSCQYVVKQLEAGDAEGERRRGRGHEESF